MSLISEFIGAFPGTLSYKNSLGQIAAHCKWQSPQRPRLEKLGIHGGIMPPLSRLNGPMSDKVGAGKMNPVSVREHKAIHFPEVFKNFF
jgi:hypothetical protein